MLYSYQCNDLKQFEDRNFYLAALQSKVLSLVQLYKCKFLAICCSRDPISINSSFH